jgi:hypothetical protein
MKLNINILSALLFLPIVSHAAEEVYYDCVPDATGRFYVEGTEGKGMRYCDWAARNHTEVRCKIDVVSWQCPIICQVPCIDTDGNGAIIGAAVVIQNVEKDTIPESAIISVGVFGALALIGLVGYGVRRKKLREDFVEETQDDWDNSIGLEPRVFDEGIPNEVYSPAKQDSFTNEGYATSFVKEDSFANEAYSPVIQESVPEVYSSARQDSFTNELHSPAKQDSFNTQTFQKTGTFDSCCDPC